MRVLFHTDPCFSCVYFLRRISSTSTVLCSMTSEDVDADLLKWCSSRGIKIDERIRVGRGDDGQISVYANDAFIDARVTGAADLLSPQRPRCTEIEL